MRVEFWPRFLPGIEWNENMNILSVVIEHRHANVSFTNLMQRFSGSRVQVLGTTCDTSDMSCLALQFQLWRSTLAKLFLGYGFCIEGGGRLRHHRSRKTNRQSANFGTEKEETERGGS